MIKPYISILIVVVVLGLGIKLYDGHKAEVDALFTRTPSKVESVGVEQHDFIIRGHNLTRVEIWGVPTGTNVDARQDVKLGEAAKITQSPDEVWRLPVPIEPLSLTTIYARGYGKNNSETNRVDFPVTGATDIYNSLWGDLVSPSKVVSLALKPGAKGSAHDLTISFDKVVEDSRCPAGVQCIQAGSITVSLSVVKKNGTPEIVMVKQPGKGTVANGYRYEITSVEPLKKAGVTPANTTYTIHLNVTKM